MLKKKVAGDKLAVLIQAPDGAQYVVARDRFNTRLGNVAHRRFWEWPETAGRRLLCFLGEVVFSDGYEMIPFPGLGYRSYFVVWFPHEADFDPKEEKWKGYLFSSTDAKENSTRTHQRILETICKKAQNLHERRRATKAA